MSPSEIAQAVVDIMARRGLALPSRATLRDGSTIVGVPYHITNSGKTIQVELQDGSRKPHDPARSDCEHPITRCVAAKGHATAVAATVATQSISRGRAMYNNLVRNGGDPTMIEQQIHAIYENGVLRPLAPVDLAEHQEVQSSFAPREPGRRHRSYRRHAANR